MTSARVAVRALVHPVSLAAIGVLALNDHVMKRVMPGVITGKISDVAGLVFFPFLLALLVAPIVRRPRPALWVALALTTAVFGATNLSQQAAMAIEGLLSPLVSWRITVDPTDLLALPALGLTAIIWKKVQTAPSKPRAETGLSPLQLIAAIAGAATALATSCAESAGVQFIEVQGHQLVAAEATTWGFRALSTDGGHTWSEWAPSSGAPTAIDGARTTKACLPNAPNHCFRIDRGPYVEESVDGGANWQVAWQLPAGRERFLSRFRRGCDTYVVAAVDLAITEGDKPLVLVAMSDDGLLRRLPDGTWERDVLGMAAPLAEFNTNIATEWFATLALVLTATLILTLWANRRIAPGGPGVGRWPALGMVVLVGAIVLALVRSSMPNDELFVPFLSVGVYLLAAVGVAGPLAVWSRLASGHPWAARAHAVVTGVGVASLGAAAIIPFLAWSGGFIAEWTTAALLSAATTGAVGLLTWRWMTRTARPQPPPPSDEKSAQVRRSLAAVQSPWSVLGALAVGSTAIMVGFLGLSIGPGLLALLIPVGVGAVYLVARWSGYQRPAPVTALALAAAALPLAFGFIFTVRATPSLLIGYLLAAIAVRAPNRWAVTLRLIIGILVILVAQSAAVGLLGLLLGPVAVVALDRVAIKLRSSAPTESED